MRILSAVMAATIGLMFMLAGCTGDPIKDDVVNYTKNGIPVFNKYGGEIGKKMEESGQLKDKNAYVAKAKNEILPLFKEYKEKMTAVKPATKEVQEIHNAYLKALSDTEEGMKALVGAIEKQDQKLAKVAEEKITAGGQAEEKYKKDFNELAQKHGVKLETK